MAAGRNLVGAAVADVSERDGPAGHHADRHDARHAVPLRSDLGLFGDFVVRQRDSFAGALGGRPQGPGESFDDDLLRDGRGDLAGRLASHSVNHAVHAELGLKDRQIFVVLTHLAAVAVPRARQGDVGAAKQAHESCNHASATSQQAVATSSARKPKWAQ